MPTIKNLEPHALWNNFTLLNAIPRGSKKEERVIEFVKNFGESLGLKTIVDEVGNVIIKKPASPGMENKTTVVLQSHLDMVHQKNAATDFDFDTQGIEMYVDGDWVRAKGTTLGSDNGIGVAAIMSILESKNIPHPPLEALFTIDEETGMTGAMGLKGGLLDAKIMLNLDTEDDDELTIGCAGGIDVSISGSYPSKKYKSPRKGWKITVKGLTGGHSGMDIHRGRGNANKLLNRFLKAASKHLGVRIHSLDGGGLRNAIPREATAIVTVSTKNEMALYDFIAKYADIFQKEHHTTDPNLQLTLSTAGVVTSVLKKSFQRKLLRAIYACPNGIYRMSPDIEGLVQTSNNLARILVKDAKYQFFCLTRGSVDTEKMDLAQAITCTFKLMGAEVLYSGGYPGWIPKPEAPIVSLMSNLYREMFEGEPKVNACHAGLECGILGTNYPEMEMISFGPNIRGAHSPDEKVQISSVQKFWKFLLKTLETIDN
ncbi:MAG TPA: aminoacyl-histidine dipeptidase [Phaeodactylibacter sp.]|nr:aminoacyl-histidine dipeptidase [Phaeodactylibacter sp.]